MTNKPKITIPETFMGVQVAGAMERVLAKEKSQEPAKGTASGSVQPFEFSNKDINPRDYLQISQLNKIISKFELPGYNDMNWQDTHFKLHQNGIYMPTIPEFMTHFQNVIDSYKSQGKKPLFDAAGNPIDEKEVEDIYLHLTKDHIAAYGNQKGAWTWLDAMFKKSANGLEIMSEHKTFKDVGGTKTLEPGKIESLEKCIMKDCYADFNKLNSQGLPTKELKSEYKQGENIYFWSPISERVARFVAGSGRAVLDCDGGPSGRYSGLGVFGVAEGK